MRVKKPLVTAEGLLCLPDTGHRLELVEGVVYKMPPTGGMHGKAAVRIGGLLDSYVSSAGLGHVFGAETGFVIARNPDTVRGPDAAFVSYDRLPSGDVTLRFPELAPDLAVEVTSPSESAGEVREKASAWLAAGTSEVWVISPQQRTVSVYRAGEQPVVLGESDTLSGGDLLPGFEISVARLFS